MRNSGFVRQVGGHEPMRYVGGKLYGVRLGRENKDSGPVDV